MNISRSVGNSSMSQRKIFALRLAVGLWCLMMMVLVNAYSGTLTSYLAVPKLRPIVNTLTELAASSETEITTDFGMEQTKMIWVNWKRMQGLTHGFTFFFKTSRGILGL